MESLPAGKREFGAQIKMHMIQFWTIPQTLAIWAPKLAEGEKGAKSKACLQTTCETDCFWVFVNFILRRNFHRSITMSAYELQREARIADNKRRMEELGLLKVNSPAGPQQSGCLLRHQHVLTVTPSCSLRNSFINFDLAYIRTRFQTSGAIVES